MSGTSVRSGLIAAVIFLSVSGPSPVWSQNAPNFMGLFGGIMQSAIADAARREWQSRPVTEYDCLENRGMSVDALVAQGIRPTDRGVRRVIAECSAERSTSPRTTTPVDATPAPETYNPHFVVDQLPLGGAVHPESKIYHSYSCRPSDQFPSFTWCQGMRTEPGKSGPQTAATSILHSESGAALYISESIEPAFFRAGDIDQEIERISQNFGLRAHVLRDGSRAGFPKGVIAIWGDVTLTPLDDEARSELQHGRSPRRGLLFDFLNNLTKSVREGLPVYHIGGGPGFLWGATFDAKGKGALRLTTIDANALGMEPPSQVADARPSLTPSAMNAPSFTEAPAAIPDPAQIAADAARREKDRSQRLEKLVPAAKQLVTDAADFVKSDPQNSKLLDYVERIAALNTAIAQNDPDDIERKSLDLTAQLSHEPVYQKLEAARAEEQKRAAAQYLGDAIKLAQRQKTFMLDFVSRNPTSPYAVNLIPLIKQIEPLLVARDLTPLQAVTQKIDLTIREAGLHDAFIATAEKVPVVAQNAPLSGSTQSSKPPGSPVESPAPQMPTTEKNRFLVDGDLDDIVLLYNAGADAPHIARNLRGEMVFSGDRADICIFAKNPDGVALAVKSSVAQFHVRSIVGVNQVCNLGRLNSYDIVASQRGAFLRQSPTDALTLIKGVELGDYRELASITAATLKEAASSERLKIEEIASDVAKGTRDGYGVVLLKTGSPNICVAASDRLEAHSQLLFAAADKLSFDMHTAPSVSSTTAENAFLQVQKAQCGAIYAAADDLKKLVEALTRDRIPYAFASIWMTAADIEAADKAARERQRIAEERATEQARKTEDERKLKKQREADQSSARSAQEQALRAQYGTSATAMAANIADDIKQWTSKQQEAAAVAYPQFVAWASERSADHWDIMTINSELEDYGTSNFKGRPLDTAFARVTMRLKNRILGEYQDACFVFGRIIDTEFAMSREPVEFSCDEEAVGERWKTGHQFESRWIAN
jgi:hypothetical protein